MSLHQGLYRTDPASIGRARATASVLERAAAPLSWLCFAKAHMLSRRIFTLAVNIIIAKQLDCSSYHSVCVCHLEELCAALSISERANPQAIGRMELLHEEVAAYLNNLR